MEDKQELFNMFMDEFVKLNSNQKNNEIVEAHKNILAYLLEYANNNGIQYDFIKSHEINDILSDSPTDDDYLEAIMVYTHNIEELIGTILQRLQ